LNGERNNELGDDEDEAKRLGLIVKCLLGIAQD
jgi:hypothetical protein